jgi:hypothetical protein
MSRSVQLAMGPMPLQRLEPSRETADAPVMNLEKSDLWAELGQCMVFVCWDARLSLKEFAGKLNKDPAQVHRQMEGKERPQIEAVFAIREFRAPLVQALARITPEIEVSTELRIRRTA